ncbi:MAG: ABC-type branched-subunit amino acid transport system ATPase component [Burkholderiaceae bacterium]|jgi:ABC-type branched-subunit amino acid transport system ATPase component
MSTTAALLTVQGIDSGYGEAMVLKELSLSLQPGEILAILGKNGMGKSTLLKTLMGFIRPKKGAVSFFGDATTTWNPDRIARQRVAYIPQEQALFQDLTVRDNLGLALARDKDFAVRFDAIADHFPFLKERMAQKAGTLSGGEQKMLLVARALICRPRLILIDEITEGMQPSVIERLIGILRQEREQFGTALLLVEQNVHFALAVADRYAVLELGCIVDTSATTDADAHARITRHLSV